MSRRPTKYFIDDIRSRFQTVAIDNKYQAFIEPNETIYESASHIGVGRRFIDEDLGLYVSDAVLPGSSFADIEVVGDRQGITERMPFSRIYDDVTFTFMVDRNYQVFKFFESWLKVVNPLFGDDDGRANNQVMAFNYPKNYKCNISIVKFNKDYFNRHNAMVGYTFLKAWPLSVASAPVSYNGDAVLTMNVTFRYDRYTMENVTQGTDRFGWRGFSDSFDPWMGMFSNDLPNSVKEETRNPIRVPPMTTTGKPETINTPKKERIWGGSTGRW